MGKRKKNKRRRQKQRLVWKNTIDLQNRREKESRRLEKLIVESAPPEQVFVRNISFESSASDVAWALEEMAGKGEILVVTLNPSKRYRGSHAGHGNVELTALGMKKLLGPQQKLNISIGGRCAEVMKSKFYNSKKMFASLSSLRSTVAQKLQLGNPGMEGRMVDAQYEFNEVKVAIEPNKLVSFTVLEDYIIEFHLKDIEAKLTKKELVKCSEGLFYGVTFRFSRPPNVYQRDSTLEYENSSRSLFWMKGISQKEMSKDQKVKRSIDFTGTGVLGHCLSYRIMYRDKNERETLCDALGVFLKFEESSLIQTSITSINRFRVKGDSLSSLGRHEIDSDYSVFPFPIRFAVQCLVANNKICLVSENNAILLYGFLKNALCSLSVLKLQKVLEHVDLTSATYILDIVDKILDSVKLNYPETVFNAPTSENIEELEHTSYLAVRRVVITPLRVIPLRPELDRGNRMLRGYGAKCPDRFIRCNIASENFGRITSSTDSMNYESCAICQRIENCLRNGINIGGRNFVYLANSNSQLRSHSCWVYDEEPNYDQVDEDFVLTADLLRNTIGHVNDRFVGKRAARIGQAFSSTTEGIKYEKAEYITVPDVKRNGYVFSDGIGMISKSAAKDLAVKLGLDAVPSAFQVRIGGSKGMLSVWSDESSFLYGKKFCLRSSMEKFKSGHTVLEICRFSNHHAFFLNKQLITLLGTMGVEDQVFWNLYETALVNINGALQENVLCVEQVIKCCYNEVIEKGHSIMSDALKMIRDSVSFKEDEFLRRLVIGLCKRRVAQIRNKFRILVDEGVYLLGILDETGVLGPNEVYVAFGPTEGANDRTTNQVILNGKILVGRNPSLNCGDLRVLNAVDRKELQHLNNVLVFSSQGDRPVPDMMSGGDLDGDEYFVIWKKEFVHAAKRKIYQPLNYRPQQHASESEDEIDYLQLINRFSHLMDGNAEVIFKENDDFISFFVKFITSDNLGVIANAFLVHADEKDAQCHECLWLAKLHSIAVDFNKTGKRAKMEQTLRVYQYPDFMGKDKKRSYKSKKILGKIFRDLQGRKFNFGNNLLLEESDDEVISRESYESGNSQDSNSDSDSTSDSDSEDEEYLHEWHCSGYSTYIDAASDMLNDYSENISKLLQNFGVENEEELLSGCVLEFKRDLNRLSEKETSVQERLNIAVYDLLSKFKSRFWKRTGFENSTEFTASEDESKKLEARRLAAAMRFITYSDDHKYGMFYSFPWIGIEALLLNRRLNQD